MDDDSTRVLPRRRRASATDPDSVTGAAPPDDDDAEEYEDDLEDSDAELNADDLVDDLEDDVEADDDSPEPLEVEDTIPDSSRSKRDRLGKTRRIPRKQAQQAGSSSRRKPRRYAYVSMDGAETDLAATPWRSDAKTGKHEVPAFVQSNIDWRHIGAWAASLGVLITLLLVVILLATGRDISEEDLVGFYEQVDAGDFDAAEQTLDVLDPSEELARRLRPLLETGRNKAAVKHRKEAAKHFANKAYRDAAAEARLAIAAASDAGTLFLLAESQRLLKDEGAGDTYERFAGEFPGDARVDDALFWRAEWLVAHHRLDEARAAFEKVVALPNSNFKTSAGRRLGDLAKE